MKDREATGIVMSNHFLVSGRTREYDPSAVAPADGHKQRYTRLLAPRPEYESTEGDVIEEARRRHEAELAKIPDPPEEREGVRWTPEAIGILVLGVRDKLTDEQIADRVHRSVSATAEQVTEVRRWMERGRRGPGNRGGKGETRARRVTPEQEREARRLYEQGAKSWEIARAVGATVGTVRYVLEHPREGA